MYESVVAVGIDYHQNHSRELVAAKQIAAQAGVYDFKLLSVPQMPSSALTDGSHSENVPDVTYREIEGQSPSYVPFRNGLLISLAAGVAEEYQASAVFLGAHAEDGANWSYADCTPPFVGAMSAAVSIGTYNRVTVRSPFLEWQKHEIVQVGTRLGVPFELSYSCYRGGELHCGRCPTCYARQEAFSKAGVVDPTSYETASPSK
jgi:7-cyano-7-deazaguanine synthase